MYVSGRSVAAVLVGSYKPYFSSVVGLVRNPSTEAAISLASAGVELRKVSGEDSADTVADVLKGVDVVVNVLNTDAASFKNIVAEAVVKAGVSVYILSEFGM